MQEFINADAPDGSGAGERMKKDEFINVNLI